MTKRMVDRRYGKRKRTIDNMNRQMRECDEVTCQIAAKKIGNRAHSTHTHYLFTQTLSHKQTYTHKHTYTHTISMHTFKHTSCVWWKSLDCGKNNSFILMLEKYSVFISSKNFISQLKLLIEQNEREREKREKFRNNTCYVLLL